MQPEPAGSERFRRMEALYHRALELPADERTAFVDKASSGNESLRQELLSLLSAHDRAADFIESPALEVAAQVYGGKSPSWIGQQIGRYQIIGTVGAGGMGEVYRAWDPRLDREVAIKILPAHLAGDPGALARFKREAQAVAALSHPNILALHDFDFDRDIHFAVMELLDGETIAKRLARTPMSWQEAVRVAAAVADGLSAAHKKGIVHRDIKPDNIFLTVDGQVKILDFGIARVPVPSGGDTQTQVTLAGLAIGTIGYMAPEQLRGETAEPAADLFSLGCVLHEMVTGARAFARNTVPEAVAAILTAEPPAMGTSTPGVPPALENVVQRCLRKQAVERFPTVQDLALALRQVLQGGTAAMASPVTTTRRRTALWVAAALAPIAAAILLWLSLRAPAPYTESLAILPILNQSGDPDLEYVTDGITESLINSMSQLPRLKVIARTTAFRYKGRNMDAQRAGRELKVRTVFTGRLVRQADSIAVQVDLINVADGSQIWGHHYNQKFSDLMTLAENISGRISEGLQLKLSASEKKSLGRGRTENQEAFRLYLLGRYHWNQRLNGKTGTVEKAIGFFQQAIEKDPLYALAYVGLSEAYATLPGYSETPALEAAMKGKAAARKALEIDETVSEAYVALASIAADEWDWPEAGKAFRRALELNPGYATVHQWYSFYLEAMGRPKEAVAEAQRAYELDPLSPAISAGLGSTLYDDHQYERAIEQFRKTLELSPNFGAAHMHAGLARLAQGKIEEALLEFDRAKALMPGSPPMALIGFAQAQLGNRQAALDMIRQVSDPAKRHKGTGFELAVLYMGLGDKDRAFEYLNQACTERAPLVVMVKMDPFFAPLRSDPRYVTLLQRMNLTP